MTPVDKQNPFNAIKIVECGEGVSAAFGAKLLADLGDKVIKVESPEGDLTRLRGAFQQRPMLKELLPLIEQIELAGKVERLKSNIIAGIKHMPVRFMQNRAVA
jgi:CoA-transferase family III